MESDLKKAEKEVSNLQKRYDDCINQINEKNIQLNYEYEDAGDLKDLGKINSLNKEITDLDNESVTLATDLENARDKANLLKNNLSNAKLNPNNSAEVKQLTEHLNNLNSKLNQSKDEANQLKDKIKDSFNQKGSFFNLDSGLSSIKEKFGDVGSKIDKFKSRMTKLIVSIAIFNLLRSGLTKLRNEFISLLGTNSQFNSSLNQIKANLMTAFAPIYNACLPAINTLMSALSKITGTIAKFISSLFGISLSNATNQAKSLSSALGDASKSADEAKGSLASFDNLEVIGDDSSSNSSSSGGGSGVDFSNDIEYSSKLLDFLNKIKDSLNGIDFSNLASSFANFKDAVKEFGAGIWQSLSDFYYNLLIPLAKYTIENWIPEFLNATANALRSIDWEKIQNSLNGLYQVLLPFIETIGDGLLWFYEKILIPLGLWTINDVLPAFLNILSGALKIFNKACEDLEPIWQWFWDNVLSKIASWTGGAIVSILKGIGDALSWISENEIAMTLLESLAIAIGLVAGAIKIYNAVMAICNIVTRAFSGIMTTLTGPIGLVIAVITALVAIIILCIKHWDEIKEAASKCWEFIKAVWNAVATWFNNNIVQPIQNFFSNLWNSLKNGAQSAWNGIKNVFSSIGSFFSGIWNTIKSTFTSIGTKIGDAIGGAFKSAINAVISTVEKGINFVPNSINKAIKLINKLPGVNIPRMSTISLPRLATGTVIPPRQEFAAILGDQKHGTNIEAPLDTIKQANREVLEEFMSKYDGMNSKDKEIVIQALTIINRIGNNDLSKTVVKGVRIAEKDLGKPLFVS